jgi:hypothetical protein
MAWQWRPGPAGPAGPGAASLSHGRCGTDRRWAPGRRRPARRRSLGWAGSLSGHPGQRPSACLAAGCSRTGRAGPARPGSDSCVTAVTEGPSPAGSSRSPGRRRVRGRFKAFKFAGPAGRLVQARQPGAGQSRCCWLWHKLN